MTLTSNQTLDIQLDPSERDFELSCSPSTLTLDQSPIATTCTAASGGFSNIVSLRCRNLPAGVPCGFEPDQISVPAGGTATSEMMIDVALEARLRSFTFRAEATGADGLLNSADIQLTVSPMCAGFVEEESYAGGACGTGQGICWGFRDGYTVFTPGEFFGTSGFEFQCGDSTRLVPVN